MKSEEEKDKETPRKPYQKPRFEKFEKLQKVGLGVSVSAPAP